MVVVVVVGGGVLDRGIRMQLPCVCVHGTWKLN
jgi:hypothetical protein